MRTLVGLEQPKDVLVAQCVAGDEAAWAALYARHARTIAHFLRRLGVTPDALEDTLQEVFLQAFRSLDKFRGEAAIRTWLYRLAITQARHSRQKARFARQVRRVLALQVTGDSEISGGALHQSERLLHSALENLSALEREAFVLYELEGLSTAELAAIFGCPEGTVYRRLHDARKKFQGFIEAELRP
jgi:RNA polymerase sigma-70 factor, ECF subfamily